ncbi:MAG: IS1634 family transposase [bacterium]|nr:IS1634 family transposase [bacterium]
MFRLGTLDEIRRREGVSDAWQWAQEELARRNEEERIGRQKLKIELSPSKRINTGECVKYSGGDLMLIPFYNALGLPQICREIQTDTRTEYSLNEILESLVVSRILYPCSKKGAYELNKKRIRPTSFGLEDIYRALSLLSSHIDDIQARVWSNSQKITDRNTRIIYYDCTNYYFEIEDNDKDFVDKQTGEYIPGLRKRGKSKENRPNPIVQMGMLMDGDGMPLSFIIFPGNESEQPSLQKIEEMVANKFGLNEFIISTDAGLGSENNRRYNMTEGREYITVQSLPSLPKADQDMALAPEGWRIAFRDSALPPIDPFNPERKIFNLSEIDLDAERHTRFYKEIIVDKCMDGDKSTARQERVIVTYSHDFALYLRHKREERISSAQKIVNRRQTKSRQSQQDPRRYVATEYITKEGIKATNVKMALDQKAITADQRFDGFYAYGTSLDDDAADVLRARSFHHEIEHLFRTTKTFLEARPVHLQRQDRIRSHFLICFLAMVIIKILQKKLHMHELTIDQLILTLRSIEFDYFKSIGYRPLFERNEITDRLQQIAGITIDTEIVETKRMNKLYRNIKES